MFPFAVESVLGNIGFCCGSEEEHNSEFSPIFGVDFVHSCLRCINAFHQITLISCCSAGRQVNEMSGLPRCLQDSDRGLRSLCMLLCLERYWCADQFHAASRMSSCSSVITFITNHWPLPFSLEAYSILWKNKRVQVRWLVEK